MKRLKNQELVEPAGTTLVQPEDVSLDENIRFSMGIPLEILFNEMISTMLQNVNTGKPAQRKRKT